MFPGSCLLTKRPSEMFWVADLGDPGGRQSLLGEAWEGPKHRDPDFTERKRMWLLCVGDQI